MKICLSDLAEKIGAELSGDAHAEASSIRALDDIKPGCVVYLEKQRDAWRLQGAPAAVICSRAAKITGHNLLVCERPKIAFARALRLFFPEVKPVPGIHPCAFAHPEADIDPSASVGPCAVVERGASIGAGTSVGACAFVGEGARIGADCILHPQASVLRGCILGDRVILHSGAVIGSDGFGYVMSEGRHMKVPQVGTVRVEDDVEIGANSAVDRATLGETRVGKGAKIDNLVQVGHNCDIGENVILCGQVGISGSCTIGAGAVLAGQVGVGDHTAVGAQSIIGGQSGVICNVPEGKFYSGMPAAPHRETMKMLSAQSRLPAMEAELKRLREEIEELKKHGT